MWYTFHISHFAFRVFALFLVFCDTGVYRSADILANFGPYDLIFTGNVKEVYSYNLTESFSKIGQKKLSI